MSARLLVVMVREPLAGVALFNQSALDTGSGKLRPGGSISSCVGVYAGGVLLECQALVKKNNIQCRCLRLLPWQ
jgi:hypothetical protein